MNMTYFSICYVLGMHGAKWSMLLNVIYMVLPIWITKKVLDKPSNMKVNISYQALDMDLISTTSFFRTYDKGIAKDVEF